jgi:hypothetical protein
VHGAGKPEQIVDHVEAFAKSFVKYCEDTDEMPDTSILRGMISFHCEPNSGDEDRFNDALLENSICRHALQVVASTLLDQKIPRDNAMRELRAAMRLIENSRAKRKKRRRHAQRIAAKLASPGKKPRH